jgi:serine/threonine protein kinase
MWVLTQKLGKGGFGEVWLARKAGTNEERAVKFCFHPVAREKLTHATHESKVARHVEKHMREHLREPKGSHPNIVPLLECNLDGETPWLMY